MFLSGDEHRGCVATVDLCDAAGNPITRVHSLHTAAVYSPYPFANSLDEDFVASETIVIADPNYGNYQCVVNTTRPPAGDGVTFLRVRQVGTAWKLDYEFADGTVQTLTL